MHFLRAYTLFLERRQRGEKMHLKGLAECNSVLIMMGKCTRDACLPFQAVDLWVKDRLQLLLQIIVYCNVYCLGLQLCYSYPLQIFFFQLLLRSCFFMILILLLKLKSFQLHSPVEQYTRLLQRELSLILITSRGQSPLKLAARHWDTWCSATWFTC